MPYRDLRKRGRSVEWKVQKGGTQCQHNSSCHHGCVFTFSGKIQFKYTIHIVNTFNHEKQH